ncbi:MAG TPA: threonine ammonia-lyase [archaeon]|nr:threonine ammonia-lyase [archaeon]
MPDMFLKPPTLNDVKSAQKNLEGIIRKIPLVKSEFFSKLSGNEIYLKLENLQPTGAFKIRGAYNKISSLTKEERNRGVIAASAGNHAQGVALSAKKLGIKSVIVMPEHTPLNKVNATKNYGAEVILYGNNYDEAYEKAREIEKERKLIFVHPFDDSLVIAGQGTISLELLEDIPDIDAIVVPIGGGGLISGIAIAAKSIKPKIKIIGVEAEGADAMKRSFYSGSLKKLKAVSTIADGIAVKKPGELTFSIIKKYVDKIVTVSDEEISASILSFLERSKLLGEPAGCAGLAAAMYGKLGLAGKKVAVIVSGGNVDINLIWNLIEKGLTKQGRRAKIKTLLKDRPGELRNFLDIVAKSGGNVLEIYHERLTSTAGVGKIEVTVAIETKDEKHKNEIVKNLRKGGYSV